MKNTILLTTMARSMLIAGLVVGITGAAYAQVGAEGVVGGAVGGGVGAGGVVGGAVGGGAGAGGGGLAGKAGEMPDMSEALPSLGQTTPRRERGVPGLGSSDEPRGAGSAPGLNPPPGMERSSVPRY
ncbi:MAG: hypothetical protein ABS69_16990 [Nitrosomonadales bacterium SCN 54-20]|nr:MAG: hypothetical protein ABS69_16990 [Nitrosomonadales bacterium SCN 54-20]